MQLVPLVPEVSSFQQNLLTVHDREREDQVTGRIPGVFASERLHDPLRYVESRLVRFGAGRESDQQHADE